LALDVHRATALRASRTQHFESTLKMHEQWCAMADGVMVVAAPSSASGRRRSNGA